MRAFGWDNMRMGVPKEPEGEPRVSIVPSSISKLKKIGFEVIVQAGAGLNSGHSDQEYVDAGAKISTDSDALSCDIVVAINPPDFSKIGNGQMLACMADPFRNLKMCKQIVEKGITLLSMEVIPRRLSKGQSMDVNSSQDNLSGYRAVLLAASHLNKGIPMMMTSAGTVKPAKFVIQGAAVAGLQAIATAKRIGAVVNVIDVRLAAKQDTESLGAKFIDVPGWKDAESSSGHATLFTDKSLQSAFDKALLKHVEEADVLITTARIFGRDAPKLFFDDSLNAGITKSMKTGSIIVDMNTDTGGNISGSVEGEIIETDGVKIIGIPVLCRQVSSTASMLYSNNLVNFVSVLVDEGKLVLNMDEQVLTGDEGSVSAGFGGILISCDGKIHENQSRLKSAIYGDEEE